MQHRVRHIGPWLRAALRSHHVHALMVQAVSAIFGFTTFILYARWMGPDHLGLLILFITAATMLDMLRSGFLQPALVREVRGSSEDSVAVVRGSAQMLGWLWSGGSAVVLSALGFSGILAILTTESTLFGLVWPLLIIASFPGQYFSWQAQSESRFDRILLFRTVNGLTMLVSTIGLHLAGRLDPTSAAASFVLAGVVAGIFVTLMRWIRLTDLRRASRTNMVSLARFGRYSMTTTLGTSLLKSSDTFLIGAMLDTTAVAIYGVAQKAVEVLDLPLRALSASVYPIMAGPGARGEAMRVGRIIERVSSGYVLALLIPAIALFALAGPLVELVAGTEYLAAVPVIRIFVVAAFLMPIDRMMGLGLDSLGRPDVNLTKVGIMLTCNVVGDIWVLSVWGSLSGVALVTIIMSSVGMLTGWVVLQPMVRLSLRRTSHVLRYWLSPAYVKLQLSKSGRGSDSNA